MAKAPIDIKADTQAQQLQFTWAPGQTCVLDYWPLRCACACASCVDEWTGQPLLDPAQVPRDIAIIAIQQVGRYAIRIVWSDGHDTGIFTWDRLRELCEQGRGRDGVTR